MFISRKKYNSIIERLREVEYQVSYLRKENTILDGNCIKKNQLKDSNKSLRSRMHKTEQFVHGLHTKYDEMIFRTSQAIDLLADKAGVVIEIVPEKEAHLVLEEMPKTDKKG